MSYSDDEEEVLELIKPSEIKIKMDLGKQEQDNEDDDTETSDDDDSDLDSENSKKIRVKEQKEDDTDDDDDDIESLDDIESVDDIDDYKVKTKHTKSNKNELPNNDLQSDESDDDDSQAGDEEDENYLQKFDDSIKQSIISEYHPELHQHNYEEVETLATVVRNELGIIIDPLHKTLPFLTKYEKARILGERAKQINAGGQPFIEVDVSTIDGYLIAMQELEQKKKKHEQM